MAGNTRARINLGKRTQQQTDTIESKGAQRKGAINYAGVPLKFFKFKEPDKIQDINILPWQIATRNHPEVIKGSMEVGDYDYVLDVWVHTKVGPNEEDFICPKKTWGGACPCCDEADALWNENTEESKAAARPLFARRKCVYQVQELDEDFRPVSEEPKIFEVAHNNFTKALQSKAASCMRGKGVVNFANTDEQGRVVSFQVSEEKMDGGRTYKKATNFEFNKRVEEVSDEVLDKCVPLDSLMMVKTPAEIKQIMFGDGTGNSSDADNGEDDQEAGEESRTLSTDSGEEFDDPFPDQPTNLRRGSRPRKEPAEEQEEPREEEPAPRGRGDRKVKAEEPKGECPNGYTFGADCDRKGLCFKCPEAIYNRCRDCSK
jgi:hypothetical protein